MLNKLCTILGVYLVCIFAYAKDHTAIYIGTAEVTGIYYPAGVGLCELWESANKLGKNIPCEVVTTRGSVMNLDLLENHKLDFAIVQSDWQSHAYNGTSIFSRRNHNQKLRTVFTLHNEPMTIVARRAANIHKLDDLRGKRVNVGSVDSGYRATLEVIMRMKGMTMSDFALATELDPDQAAKALCNNQVDAFLYAVGHPNYSIQQALERCDVNLVEVYDSGIQQLVNKTPFYYHMTIPARVYKEVLTPINTFGIKAALVTHADEDPEVVYQMVKATFENLETFKKIHPLFDTLNPAEMINYSVIPLHPGAEKYYRERGWYKSPLS